MKESDLAGKIAGEIFDPSTPEHWKWQKVAELIIARHLAASEAKRAERDAKVREEVKRAKSAAQQVGGYANCIMHLDRALCLLFECEGTGWRVSAGRYAILHEKQLAALEAKVEEQAARIAELEVEDEAHYRLIHLQRERMRPAVEMWRRATGALETTYPDLGELIEFLLARIAVLEEALRYLRSYGTMMAIPAGACRPCRERVESALSTAPSGMVAVERERLEEIEWACLTCIDHNRPLVGRCPICGKTQPEGHAPDCWIAAKLKGHDGEA